MFSQEAIQELSKAQAISAASNAIAHVNDSDLATVALPNDFNVHDFERFLLVRRRARGNMATSNVPDFAKYVGEHKELGAAVFVRQDKMTAVAVLNLGTPAHPGHTDNTATLAPKKTAAYTALKGIATGAACAQQKVAEFLEDWPAQITCFNDAGAITPAKAIAAIRKITIENLKKLEATEGQLSASKSAFESVTATSTEPLPTTIYFKTVPYHGLQAREFVLRLGILSGGDKPAVNLRIINQEQHDEDMAIELADLVKAAVTDLPVLVGEYSARS
jgi:uncharacterized protein YfdQ (DUF2303 family)